MPDFKFCGKCGTSLASLSNKPEPVPVPPAPVHPQAKKPKSFTPFMVGQDDDEDENRYDNIEHLDIRMDKLDVEIIMPQARVETIGGLVKAEASLNSQSPPTIIGRAAPKITKKQFASEWAKEAGSIRKE